MNITERRQIHNKFHPPVNKGGWNGTYVVPPHPLEGRSVAQWVAEARKGWPKVPVPSDPYVAARKVLDKHADDDVLFERI
ncbi:hypothetical protein [Streptomyces sp. NPDC015131]|uniref:hypothetical protein n=1 Tax=Streptomyces sp. NPDC015131 TaxID=3364941 RepID=UPI0036FC5D76